MRRRLPGAPLFPYTTLFRSDPGLPKAARQDAVAAHPDDAVRDRPPLDHLQGRLQPAFAATARRGRSEEHTSELQSRGHLVCRLLLEKKNSTLMQVSLRLV